MIEREYVTTPSGTSVLLTDSVSFIRDEDRGTVVVCASHGGESSGEYALQKQPGLIFFNDAGVGKDRAGIRALVLLEEAGIAAAAISSDSARIGDVLDHWSDGVVSQVNTFAGGVLPGTPVVQAIDAWVRDRPNAGQIPNGVVLRHGSSAP